MSVFLPVAGISINVFVLAGTGALVGFLAGLLGVGGGFLLTPILMMLGISPAVAAASGSCQLVAASTSGAAVHFRLGNVDLKMGTTLLVGGLAGAALGVELIRILRGMGNADMLITAAYVVVLGGIGGLVFVTSLRNLRGAAVRPRSSGPPKLTTFLGQLPFQVYYPVSRVRHSLLVPFSLCCVAGMLAAVMGVGGGFLMVPMMVYLLRMPAHVAVGTDLFQIVFTSAGVTYLQATTNHTVDLVLALLLAGGSAIGAQLGARASPHLRGDLLLIILASLALLVAGRMMISTVTTPANLLSLPEQRSLLRNVHTQPVPARTGT